jgi:hypothetical protein
MSYLLATVMVIVQAAENFDAQRQGFMPVWFKNNRLVALVHSKCIEYRDVQFTPNSKLALVLNVEHVALMLVMTAIRRGCVRGAFLLKALRFFGVSDAGK